MKTSSNTPSGTHLHPSLPDSGLPACRLSNLNKANADRDADRDADTGSYANTDPDRNTDTNSGRRRASCARPDRQAH